MRLRACSWGILFGLFAASVACHANVIHFAVLGSPTSEVQITGVPGTTGSVTSPNGFSARFVIGPDAVTTVSVCCALSGWSAVSSDGFVIRTDRPFAVVGAAVYNPGITGDMTALFDQRALGTSYTVMGRPDTLIVMTKPPQNGNPPEFIYGPSEFAIVGTRDGTKVTITPSSNFYSPGPPSGSGGPPAGVPFTVTLNAGQVVRYGSVTDVTGTKIQASAPVSVIAGTVCSGDKATGCASEDTAIPDNTKFTRTAVVPASPNQDKAIVLARKDGTVVRWNGTVVATLAAGEHIDIDATGGGIVTASKPVLVAKSSNYLSSHSTMTWVPGVDQWTNSYFFSIPGDLEADEHNYLDVAIRTSDLWSLMLNGEHVARDACARLGSSFFSTCEFDVGVGAFAMWDRDPFLLLASPGGHELTFTGADFMSQPWRWGPRSFAVAAADPVPEPGTLMLTGTVLLVLFRRRAEARRAPQDHGAADRHS
jgi:hypothetical protein